MITNDNRLNTAIIIFLFIIALLIGIVFAGMKGFFAVAISLFGMILISRPGLLLLFYWLYVLWIPFLSQIVLFGGRLQFGDELLALCLLGVLISQLIIRKSLQPKLDPLLLLILISLFFTALSAFANTSSKKNILRFLLIYYRFVIVFYYSVYLVTNRKAKLLFRCIIATFVLQMLLNFGWAIGINPLPNRSIGTADFCLGTGISANNVAYYMIAFSLIIISYINSPLGPRKQFWFVVWLIPVFVQIYLTYTVHAYFLLPVIGLFHWVLFTGKKNRILTLAICSLLVIGLSLCVRHGFGKHSRLINQTASYDYAKRRFDRMIHGVKGQLYANVFFHAMKDMRFPLLGAGPGNFTSPMAMATETLLVAKYVPLYYITNSGYIITTRGSITEYPYTGMTTIWGELGPVGFLVYWGLHVYASFHVYLQLKRRQYKTFHQHVLAQAYVSVMIMYIGLNTILDFANHAFLSNGIWIWAGCVWYPLETRSNKPNNTSEDISQTSLSDNSEERTLCVFQ